MRVVCGFSQARKHQAVITELSVVLVSPGPALTPGLVLDNMIITVDYKSL